MRAVRREAPPGRRAIGATAGGARRRILDPRRKRLLACDDDGLRLYAPPPPGTLMIASPVAPQWVSHPRQDRERALALSRELGAPLPAAATLVNRGVDTAAAARRFLEPSLDDLHDPYSLLDLE